MDERLRKVAEAIRAGWKIVGQKNTGALFNRDANGVIIAACALGCAAIGCGYAGDEKGDKGSLYTVYENIIICCAGENIKVRFLSSPAYLSDVVWRLNDRFDGELTMDEIADQIEVLEVVDELPAV